MRITIIGSAHRHGITGDEIRTVINHYSMRWAIDSRHPSSIPFLYVGAIGEDEPHIEVITDERVPGVAIAFHAMMLRPATIASADLAPGAFTPNYGPQRPDH